MRPAYILDEARLRQNLALISEVAASTGVEIILALKAFALWKVFPIFTEYIHHTTASSIGEARMSHEEFGGRCYTYTPAYEDDTFAEMMSYSEHITFNSLSQYNRFAPLIHEHERNGGHHISIGLRINPEYSEIDTDLYNPCAPGSRLGILGSDLPTTLPDDVEGLHFHCLCENDASALVNVLRNVEDKFGQHLDRIKWLNMGGGHLMTRKGYDIALLRQTLAGFRQRHPHLQLIMEPGSAFLWDTGILRSQVVDIVCNSGIKTATLNVSFACHMPDCLEMPYQPRVAGADIVDSADATDTLVYRLGGNSCLSGDFVGYWKFGNPLNVGDTIEFQDMIHYTTVKTHMFNGISHPDIAMRRLDGSIETMKVFDYDNYKHRMC